VERWNASRRIAAKACAACRTTDLVCLATLDFNKARFRANGARAADLIPIGAVTGTVSRQCAKVYAGCRIERPADLGTDGPLAKVDAI